MFAFTAVRVRRWIALSGTLAMLGACSDRAVTDAASSRGERPPTSSPAPAQLPKFDVVGSQTYTETINSGYHFGQYLYYNGDWDWQHSFPLFNTPGLQITSAKLSIYAYDVDAEPFHGTDGEYDGISVDGTQLDPGYLQGANNTWSTTTFDVPLSAITDDGIVHVHINIDMFHDYDVWATQLNSSTLTITYTIGPVNAPPYTPTLSGTPSTTVEKNQDMTVNVTGPNPADPDGDAVTYEYRWFLNTGTGGFLDPSIHGRPTFTGPTVPASATELGDQWRVQVTPRDAKGAIGSYADFTFGTVVPVSDDTPPVITPTVTGTKGTNDWYTSDVNVSFAVSDDQSAVTEKAGCDAVTITTNQAGQSITCTAKSTGGSATSTVVIKRDATPPTITGTATGTQGDDQWFTGDAHIAFTASDDISGVSSTDGCAKTQTTDTKSQEYDCTVTNGAGLTATAKVTVKRDASKPVITPSVVGTMGSNSWFVSDVQVGFSAADDISAIVSPACTSSTLSTDTGAQSYGCTAKNGAGLVSSANVTIKRDATKPHVELVGNAGAYTVDQTIDITCSISDAMSGVATQSCNGAAADAYTLSLGTHHVSASATDFAGNQNSASGDFSVTATTGSVCALVNRWVGKAGVASSMCSKLDAAQASFDRGNRNAGDNQLDALINDLQAQSGKAVTSDKAAILIGLAQALK